MTQDHTSDKDMRRLSLRFEGEVQGVGFRWTSRRIAQEIGLTGWVRNEWDGSVSMELQGTSDQIARFFGRLARAWSYYQPDYVIDQKEEIPVVDHDNTFQVRF
jgi:acylphosphatase